MHQQLHDFTKRFLRRFGWAMALVFTLDLLANLLALSLSVTLALAYTQLFGFGSAKGRIIAEQGWALDAPFRYWMWVLVVCVLLRFFLDFQKEKQRAILSERLVRALRPLLFRQQLRLNAQAYEEKGAGRFLLRFSGDLSSVQQLISKGILQFAGDLMLVGMGIVLIGLLDWRLGGAVLLCLLGLAAWVAWVYFRVGRIEEDRRNRRSGLLSLVSRSLHGVTTLKAFNQEVPLLSRFEHRADRLETLGIDYAHWSAAAKSSINAGVYGCILVAMLVMAHLQVQDPAFDAGKFFLLLLVLLSWRGALARLFRVGLVWKKGMISWHKIGHLLSFEQEQGLNASTAKLPDGPLRLEGVGLKQEEDWIFEGLNAELGLGQMLVCIGGPNSGKTAFVKLLAHLCPPTVGQISLGGVEQQAAHPKSWRRQLSFIGPIFPLTGRTLFEAISYSRKPRHKQRAAELFHTWQAIFPPLRPLKLEDRLGAEGRLSSSQIQLLMWMRALLSRKGIIVADEPWTGLDEAMQATLAQWLQQYRPNQAWVLLSTQETVARFMPAFPAQRLYLDDSKKNNPAVVTS